ncbi:competence protein CoiA [Thalassobacillus hwangdonensis]|uniref:Competence protein CoiA n=1 Tax=Thalassobacillus hwangdonensis TaxID=546108 RepID=A0ABW3KYB2_9BACI
MLSALDRNGRSCSLIHNTKEEIRQLKQNENYYCPVCKEKVLVRAGKKVIPHFSHFAKTNCLANANGGEGAYHESGKLQLYHWLCRLGFHVKLEPYIEQISQRPDLLFEFHGKIMALEYQCATIPLEEMEKRTSAFKSIGIYPFWILGGNHFNRMSTNTIRLNTFQQSFIHSFPHDLRMFFFCADSGHFLVCKNMIPKGKKSFFTSIHSSKLPNLTFPQLFGPIPLNRRTFYTHWANYVKKVRTTPVRHPTKAELAWRNELYRKGMHPSLLPSICYLPTPHQILSSDPPWFWQSRILLRSLLDAPLHSRISLRLPLKQFSFPLIESDQDPWTAYMDRLVDLGLIEMTNSLQYRKIRHIKLPATVDEALSQDRQTFHQLSQAKGRFSFEKNS